jgi:hypothetical protein
MMTQVLVPLYVKILSVVKKGLAVVNAGPANYKDPYFWLVLSYFPLQFTIVF